MNTDQQRFFEYLLQQITDKEYELEELHFMKNTLADMAEGTPQEKTR